MGLAEDSHAQVLIADYIGTDAAGKINALGAGFVITGLQATGLTPPQYVVALIDVASEHAGREFPLLLELRDIEANVPVQVPGPTGGTEALRIQQLVKAERPQVPGIYLPENLFSRVQVSLGFPNGLPLAPGRLYEWRLEVNGTSQPGWRARFYVAGPPPAPVFGGPIGPADIPTLPTS